jgi:hypothetical protein
MMKPLQFAIAFLFGFQDFARASLGDTEAQLIARYGAAIGPKSRDQAAPGAVALDRISFQKAGIVYQASIFKGVSSEESIFHRPYSALTDEEVKSLLAANTQGQVWKEIAPQPEFTTWLHALKSWQRSDGAIASLEGPKDRPRLLFHLKSKVLIDAESAANTKLP